MWINPTPHVAHDLALDAMAHLNPTAPPVPFPPLVGRVGELATLLELVETTSSGDGGGVVVIDGEAGVGKSRLVAEAAVAARPAGFTVLVGSADEVAHDRPLGPIAAALGLYPAAPTQDQAELRRMLVDSSPGDGPPGPVVDVGYRIVESLVSHLESMAAVQPVLLALEDLHWADPLTIRAIRAIGRALVRVPVALILTCRPWPQPQNLDRVIDELVASGGRRLGLTPLAPAEGARLAEHLAGAPLGPRLTAQVDRAAGNPLFVIELVRALADEGAIVLDGQMAEIGDLATPSTLLAVLRSRLSGLPDATLEVLKVASVLGERFGVADLAAAMAVGPVALLSTLEEAVRAGLLVAAGEELAFRHELVREAVYGDLPLAVRKALHRQMASVLATAGASLGTVADHLVLGATAGDTEAVDWLARSARQVAVRAPVTAVGLLERALELADPADPDSDALACDLAPLLIQTGRADEAQRLSNRVLDRCPAPSVEAGLRRALGEVLWALGALEAAVEQLDAAATVDGISERQRVGPSALAAHIRLLLGQTGLATEGAEGALAQGRTLGDDMAVCLALQTLAVLADIRGDLEAAIDLAQKATAIAVGSTQPLVGHLNPHLYLGLILLDADRAPEAETVLQQGRRQAEARGTVLWLPFYHCALAIGRFVAGDWDDALAEVEAGLAVADEVGTRLYVPFLFGVAALIAIGRGDLARAQDRLDHAVREFLESTTSAWQAKASEGLPAAGPRWPLEYGLWIAALLHEAHGDSAEALRTMEEAWTAAAPLRNFLAQRFFAPDLVRLALAAGSRQVAAAVSEEAGNAARRSGTAGANGAALRCRGLVDEDPDALLAAASCLRPTGSVMEMALTLEEAGGALGRTGRRPEAVAALEEALSIFDRVGATRARARTDATLRSLGVRHRRAGAGPRPVTGWESLTPTEVSVAALVAQGLTNRQVGERLFVSRRTVETHLAHVYAKLVISSRAELAAQVARR